jgi:hypothetical protein
MGTLQTLIAKVAKYIIDNLTRYLALIFNSGNDIPDTSTITVVTLFTKCGVDAPPAYPADLRLLTIFECLANWQVEDTNCAPLFDRLTGNDLKVLLKALTKNKETSFTALLDSILANKDPASNSNTGEEANKIRDTRQPSNSSPKLGLSTVFVYACFGYITARAALFL